MAPVNLDISILWRNLSEQGLELDLTQGGSLFEASVFEPRLAYFVEKMLEKGALNFNEQEEFLEAYAWWKENLGNWSGANAQYAAQFFVLLEKVKTRLKF